jgi:ABC-type polysaccharide/polyol phosphate export permease
MDNETINESPEGLHQQAKSDGMAQAYKLHKNIGQVQEKINRVKGELKRTHLAAKFAFIGTLIVYFVFIWSLYIADLWGFATWLRANLSEVVALPVFAVLGVTLPLAMAFIKHVGYDHLAYYDTGKATKYLIVFFMMFSGVVYEAISSSSQQQHIAHTSAESSKTFSAIMGTSAAVSDNSKLITDIAKAEAKLAQCEARLREGKEKHCSGSQAAVSSLKAALAAANAASVQASTQAIDAKANAAAKMKEDGFKPVYKFARDIFKVTISTGVVIVAIVVSIIFEISHGLLVVFLMQKQRYLDYLENTLIDFQARYMTGTGKVHASEDFTDSSVIDMDDLRDSGEVRRQGMGFTADIHATAYGGIQHNRQAIKDFEQARAQGFGFIPPSASLHQNQRQAPYMQPSTQPYTRLSALALLDAKQLAKSKAFGEVAHCPACNTPFTKTNVGQIFCSKDHKGLFNQMLRQSQKQAKN